MAIAKRWMPMKRTGRNIVPWEASIIAAGILQNTGSAGHFPIPAAANRIRTGINDMDTRPESTVATGMPNTTGIGPDNSAGMGMHTDPVPANTPVTEEAAGITAENTALIRGDILPDTTGPNAIGDSITDTAPGPGTGFFAAMDGGIGDNSMTMRPTEGIRCPSSCISSKRSRESQPIRLFPNISAIPSATACP